MFNFSAILTDLRGLVRKKVPMAVVCVAVLLPIVFSGGGGSEVDASDLESFIESIQSLKAEAAESEDVTPSTEATVDAVFQYVVLCMAQAGIEINQDRSGSTKAELLKKFDKQFSKVIEPFDGLSIEDFSSKSERLQKAMEESRRAHQQMQNSGR